VRSSWTVSNEVFAAESILISETNDLLFMIAGVSLQELVRKLLNRWRGVARNAGEPAGSCKQLPRRARNQGLEFQFLAQVRDPQVL
jgi:hypothetical protein